MAIVMIIAGGLEIPCRIANGVLVDRHLITATQQYILSLIITAILTLICAIVSGLPGKCPICYLCVLAYIVSS